MRTLVIGIVNVTPDSFSDGGQHFSADEAIAFGRKLIDEGADILDVGGESTRPGAEPVDVEEELRRVIPVIAALADEGVTISVDTMHSEVARAAVEAGAVIVNDVSGGLADPQMFEVVAELGVDYVLGHWPMGPGGQLSHSVLEYVDVTLEVQEFLWEAAGRAIRAGIAEDRIIFDPGLGFAKNADHNWALLSEIERLTGDGIRIVVGASRKRFLGELLAGASPEERDSATSAITAWCAERGVWAVRTHAVKSNSDTVQVIAKLQEAQEQYWTEMAEEEIFWLEEMSSETE